MFFFVCFFFLGGGCCCCFFTPFLQRELVALLKLFSCCRVGISVMWLFLAVSWVGLLSMFVVFTDNTHLFIVKIWNYVTENNVTILFKSSRAK